MVPTEDADAAGGWGGRLGREQTLTSSGSVPSSTDADASGRREPVEPRLGILFLADSFRGSIVGGALDWVGGRDRQSSRSASSGSAPGDGDFGLGKEDITFERAHGQPRAGVIGANRQVGALCGGHRTLIPLTNPGYIQWQ